MILDDTQIKAVELYITKRKIDFVDIKFELLDHMVCDIEATMEAKNIGFNDAFNITKRKWSPYFVESQSIWMGLAYVKPKIVIDKCGAIMKKTVLYSLAIACVGAVLMWFLLKTSNADINLMFYFLYKGRWVLFAVSLIILVYHSWNILRTKAKTVFGYCYMRQFSLLPLFTLLINPTASFSTSFWGRFLPLAFLLMFITYYYFAFKIYSEHVKYVKRYFQLT
ncbi:hypothetical protein [Jejuia pallidilutea]|uniref:Uncharacterized protein n=2 Tax=Jejuia pallidilutea TaxID=504487 RepID=A0A098LQC2_9FLAO|nr:hypothetical protein [Jejuia pallidilutea]PQV49671.1 hypothetical protein CLV33_103309 [Jejuia pallidilutea]GAL89136.1 hypothetical protein JCM19538_2125 [Jejuia pallidilutea]